LNYFYKEKQVLGNFNKIHGAIANFYKKKTLPETLRCGCSAK